MTNVTTEELRIEYTDMDEILGWPKNPKLHEVDMIEKSMERFGYTQPVMLDESSGRLVAGHGRVETLQKIRAGGGSPPDRIKLDEDGAWLIPVLRGISFSSEDEGAAYVVADNRLNELGGWDDKLLADILETLRDNDALDGIGFNFREIESLLSQTDDARQLGLTPEEKLQTYLDAEIKQIVLYFSGEQYEGVVSRLGRMMEDANVDNHTDAFITLLQHYEDSHGLEDPEEPAEQPEPEANDGDGGDGEDGDDFEEPVDDASSAA